MALTGASATADSRRHTLGSHGRAERLNGGVHSILESDHSYIFIDACMQIWPDADLTNAHRHGVTAYTVTAWTPNASIDHALERLMYWHLIARKNPNLFVASTVEDVLRAKREKTAALILTAQDGAWIGDKLHRIEALQRLGLRMMLPACNRTNHLCDGCLDRTSSGLTRIGQLVVDESNRVGILLDCSQVGKKSTLEIIDRSQHPCVFSHSNPSAIVPNPRNIDDEQIKACAARGGVIGLVSWGPLVMRHDRPHWPTLDEFIDLIDHVAGLLGNTDNVGISTDMSIGTYPDPERNPWGEPILPDVSESYKQHVTADIRSPRRNINGFSDYAEVLNLIDRLERRGYKDADIRKILGDNFLRVFTQVWRG
jgi:membrane dipeptidase